MNFFDNHDILFEIMKHLDILSLNRISIVSKLFYDVHNHDSIWKMYA